MNNLDSLSDSVDWSEQSSKQLESIRARMQAAYDREKWQDLAGLDKECRSLVSELSRSANLEIIGSLTDTLRFYADLVARCQTNKNRLAAETIQLRQSQGSSRVYRSLNVIRS